MAREVGAKMVYMASAAPPVSFPNVYGIDMPAAEELIAHDREVDQICQAIGADGLIYQDLQDLIDSVRELNADLHQFETSCFDGCYIAGDINENYLSWLSRKRADAVNESVSDEQFVDVGMD